MPHHPPSDRAETERAQAVAAASVPAVTRLRRLDSATVALAALWLPTLALLGFSLAPPINHDVAALLHYAERWVGGERLYVDLIDINPPLIFLLTAVPALLATALPFGTVAVLQASLVAGIGFALYLAWRVATLDPTRPWAAAAPGAWGPRHWILAVLLPFLGFGYALEMFGQREHLMLAGALPYLLAAERRAVGEALPRRLEAIIAVLAAILFALKPYFLAVPALVEAQLLLVLGWRRYAGTVTPWVIGALWLGYALAIGLFFSAYVTLVMPFAVGVYQRLDFSLAGAAFGMFGFPPLLGLAVLAPLAFRREASALARLVALATAGAWIGGIAQGKGWPYHMLPAEGLLLLLAGVLGADLLGRLLPAPERGRAGPLLGWLVLGLGLVAMGAQREPIAERAGFAKGEIAEAARLFAREAPGCPVLVLSASLTPFFPALNYGGAAMGSRFMTMWMLQGAYAKCPANGRRYHRMRDMSRAERFAYRAVTADLVDRRPKLVVVDRLSGILSCAGREFDLLAYFLRNPVFADAFARYESIASPIVGLRVFRLRE